MSVASHYAVLLDLDRDDLTVVGHVGRPDDLVHGLGEREEFVRRLERGTVGFRLTPTRVVAKRKLSQNRPDEVVDEIILALEEGRSPYTDPRLAGEMRRAHDAMRAARGAS